jgi:hypothetical protein
MPEVTIIDDDGKLRTGTLLTEDEVLLLDDDDLVAALESVFSGYAGASNIRKMLTKLLQTHYVRARVLRPVLTAETIKDAEFQDVYDKVNAVVD